MSNYLAYINMPAVPENLLESVETIINKTINPKNIVPTEYHFFQTRPVSDELQSWTRATFKVPCYAQYQIIREGIDIHRDPGRNVAFNYILDAGGAGVLTCFYEDDLNLVFKECIPTKTWHRLKTDVLHDVRGIQYNRVALTVSILGYKWNDPMPFDMA